MRVSPWILPPALFGFLLSSCGDLPGEESSSGTREAVGAAGAPALPARHEDVPPPVDRDLVAIEASDTLVALLASNSTSYFVYRGDPMGYEFELLRAFAADRELTLGVRVVEDPREIFRMLSRGEGDVAAARIQPLPPDTAVVAFTTSIYRTRPALVERAGPDSARPLVGRARSRDEPGGGDATRPLVGRTQPRRFGPDSVRVRARILRPPPRPRVSALVPAVSEYGEIVELTDSAGNVVELVEVEDAASHEELIAQVASGEIRLTVSPENLARLSTGSYAEITVRPASGPGHDVAWAVRSNAPALREALDAWLVSEERAALRRDLYFKYFVDRSGYGERVASEYLTSSTGRLSRFDTLLVREAGTIGWDWRLLASQVYQESRFQPDARSWAGARGLLQLMPRTAREMGVQNPTDPAQNVAGGVRYLEWLDRTWGREIADPAERLRFVLASYNAGRGHVQDAQRLAEKYGADPHRWADVSYWLLQKSTPRYYRDPVVRFGFVRGREPVEYVSRILERYEHYRAVEVPERPRGSGRSPLMRADSGRTPG